MAWLSLLSVIIGGAIGSALRWMVGVALNPILPNLCGGFTTFSAFSGETVGLMLRQEYGWSFAVIAAHVLGSLAMTLAGLAVVRALIRA